MKTLIQNHWKQIFIPLAAGILGTLFLSVVYIGLVSLAESFKHAVELFWEDRWITFPIILGFGIQSALYSVLKFRLYLPVSRTGGSSAMMGSSGTASALAMAACCAHHLSDVLPLLGLSAATAFLGQYRVAFMVFGLGTTILGIGIMLHTLWSERKKVLNMVAVTVTPQEMM